MRTADFSIVIPVFNEAGQIASTLAAIRSALCEVPDFRASFILVDDGSSDRTWEVISAISSEHADVRGIRLSRNFGKEAALCAGLDLAGEMKTDACIVMDADLQHPPELIPRMVTLWREGYDVVEGVKSSRGRERLLYRMFARAFYGVMGKLSGFDFDDVSDFKLLDMKVVDSWKKLGESRTFFRGMTAWMGYPRATLPFDVAERTTGRSGWSAIKLIRLATDAVSSFTSAPLHFVTILGCAMFVMAVLLGTQALYKKLAGVAVDGFTTVILLQLLIGSSVMISLGIIGVYIARIFDEVKHRPRYLVQETTAAGREDD
jgi:dolichol-phosphate mannosyltransferase